MPLARMTHQVKLVLAALDQAGGEALYGQQILRATGIQAGTLFPIMTRLRDHGYVHVRQERGSKSFLGRPLRNYYKLTAAGIELARSPRAQRRTPAV